MNEEKPQILTESNSLYDNLELFSTQELLEGINSEDAKVARAVELEIPNIVRFIDDCLPKMQGDGRLFYIGAGTSGRLAVVDASECPPTFGVSPEKIVGIIAGGDRAIRKAVEFAEDNTTQGWLDLQQYKPTPDDTLIGIAASGKTPYVVETLKTARKNGMLTAGLSCNPNSPVSQVSHHAITPLVGPEFITGSTRMKAGTAQKLVLNMISSTLMIKLGHVKGNKMVDMQLSNNKLFERGVRMIVEKTGVSLQEAEILLKKNGSVRKVIENFYI